MSVTIERTLQELADEINREHGLVLDAVSEMVRHAITVGHALLSARAQLAEELWPTWVAENCTFSMAQAKRYQRLAHYEWIVAEASSMNVAHRMIAGLPRAVTAGKQKVPEWRPVALRLKAEGAGRREIADMLGVSARAVDHACKSDEWRTEKIKRESARKKEQRRILRKARRDAAVREAGGGISEAYSLVLRAAQVIDRVSRDGANPEIRQLASRALSNLYRCEDEIVKAAQAVRRT